MPDKRDTEALIERAIREGAEVTIVTIRGGVQARSEENAPTAEPRESPGVVADPMLVIDPASTVILETNAAFRAWASLPAGEALPAFERLDPDGGLLALARRVLENGQPSSARIFVQAARGRITVEAVAIPITGRDGPLAQLVLRETPFTGTAETDLRRSLRRLTEILDALPTPLLTLDRAGRIVSANPAAESLLARGAAVRGLEIEALAAPISAHHLRELVVASVNTKAPQTGELVLTVDQQSVPIEVTLMAAGEGEDFMLTAVLRDLRPERDAELARAQLLGRQHQTQKLEAIGRLAGGIAADVNNILASILGYADLALEDLPSESKGRESVEQVLKAGRRGKALIRQIVALGRGEEMPARRIRLDELLRTTLEALKPIMPAEVALETRVTAPTAAVMGDAAELHQVLFNLCRNSIQAIGDRPGRIEILLEAVETTPAFAERPIDPHEDASVVAARAAEAGSPAAPRPARIFLGRLEPGPYVRITVSDSGEGMPAAVLGRVFEPFFTTRKLGEASGLGLAVVHGIVAAHGGAIIASSTPGGGTRVEVFLPRSHRATELLADEIQSDRGETRVLLAGSTPEGLTPMRRVLESAGLTVEAATSGRAALETFRSEPEGWRVVVLEDGLQDVSTESLGVEISRVRPDLPIILCFEPGKTVTLDRIRASGVTEFVATPVDPEELAVAVERALRTSARRG
jgi:signal transduction histidine kinase